MLYYLIALSLAVTLVLPHMALAGPALQRDSGGPVTVGNEQIEARANEWGQYTIGTRGGDPATADDDGRRLMYGHGGLGYTSFTTLRVVSEGQARDLPLLQSTNPSPRIRTVRSWQAGCSKAWRSRRRSHPSQIRIPTGRTPSAFR